MYDTQIYLYIKLVSVTKGVVTIDIYNKKKNKYR